MTIRKLKSKLDLAQFCNFYLFFLSQKNFEKSVRNTLASLHASEGLRIQADELLALDEDKDSKIKKLHLGTDRGGKIFFFSLADVSVYEQHTQLRKVLGSHFEHFRTGRVHLNVKALSKFDQARMIEAVSTLLVTSLWESPKVTSKKKPFKKVIHEVTVESTWTEPDVKKMVERGRILAESNNLVRTLSDTPTNLLTPEIYVDLLKARARAQKYKFEFFNRRDLEKIKAGAFLAVTQGNLQDKGGIVHLRHRPKGAKKKLLLVGKGLCFDTGGYNVKVKGMYGMQKDMAGSAVALATFEAMIQLKLPYEVHAFLGIAENLISHQAYKPADVVVASDGTSIEVTDTDAEGRMVLADVLVMAKREGGNLVLDFATLTGAVVRALDMRRAGVFTNRPELIAKAFKVGETCGERVWGFPIGEDYRENLKSDVADIIQCRVAPEADHIYAATFLSHFIGEDIPWVHMDLAGTSEVSGGLGLASSTSTGYGVRWAVNFSQEILGARI